PQNFAVIRFKVSAGQQGDYRLETAVKAYLETLPGDSDFHVLKNGVELFGQFLSGSVGTGYTNTLALAAGDTIDFAVGRGADGHLARSGLKIAATLTLDRSNSSPACVQAPAGLVGWWPLDNIATDAISSVQGIVSGDPTFAA